MLPPIRRTLTDTAAAALVIALLATAAGCSRDGGTAEARTPGGGPNDGGMTVVLATSDVAVAERASIESGIAVTGDLKPIEEVTVRARLEGDVRDVLVREGDRVSAGQLLARFESTQEESDRASAVADQAAASSDLTTAEWNAEQSAELFRAGAISEQANRTAQQAVVAARARVAAAEARVRSTGRLEDDTRVLSPTNGVIGTRMVERGERISRGASMFTVVRNDRLELRADVPARQAGDIRPGQEVRFVADGHALQGEVARVSPTVNPATRAVAVYVQVTNPGGQLRGNTFASGRIIGRTIDDAILIPTAAVRRSGDDQAPFVYRIDGDRLERVEVRVDVVDEARGVAQITEGISVGDRVVVGNVGAVGTGSRVQIVGEQAGGAEGSAATGAPGNGDAAPAGDSASTGGPSTTTQAPGGGR